MSDAVTLTDQSRPWGGQATGSCGPYTDGQWRDVWETLYDGSGNRGPLLNWGGEFEVTERGAGANQTVDVADGAAVIDGEWASWGSTINLAIANNDSGLTRYDLVFLHWTAAAQVTQIRIVDGTPGAGSCESITNYQNAGVEWAVPLACVEVTTGSPHTIVNANITDLREFCRFRTDAYDLIDNSTLDLNTSLQIQIADGGVGVNQIAAAIAGAGLVGGAGAALDVNVDGVTLEINADQVRIMNGEVRPAIVQDRTRYLYVGANQLHETLANPPAWGAIGAQPVPAEGWVLPTGVDRYVVGHIKLPADATSGQVTVTVIWSHVAGANQVCRWQIIYISNHDCDDDLTAGTTTLTDDHNALLAEADYRLCDPFASTIGLNAGQYLDFQVGRNGAHGNDTYAGSAVLLGVLFSYTADM
jgi:hypothetical protein